MRRRWRFCWFVATALAAAACSGSGGTPPVTATTTSTTTSPAQTTIVTTPATSAATSPTTVTAASTAGTTSTVPALLVAHGFSFSPENGGSDSFLSFFATAAQGSTLVTWAGDWLQLADPDGAPAAITAAAAAHGLDTMVVVGPFSDGYAIRPLDTATADTYREAAVGFAADSQPRLIVIGVEVDVAAERDPDAFAAFVPLFAATAGEIHQVSPATQVLVAFQLESLSGRRDGLFGGEQTAPRWDLIQLFPDADIVAFTTYPGLIYTDPADLPDDYYSRLPAIAAKPIAFIEAGWFSTSVGTGWESDDEEQARFVHFFLEEAARVSAEPVIWSFLYDQAVSPPFDSMGLLAAGETRSPGWDAWLGFWSSASR